MLNPLERLFPQTQFLAEHWPSKHVVSHGPLKRLGSLPGLAEFSDLSLLLRRFDAPIRVALADKRDEHSSREVDAATALQLHGDGLALILDGVERVLPEVQQWLGALRAQLQLPVKCLPRAIVYASPRGAGNSPHFDANANFVVQLRGTKRWWLAPNQHVVNPTDRFAMNQEKLSGELAGYVEEPFPDAMPDDAVQLDLAPGSVLFVPRGYWHATESNEDTLALNFTFGQPTWADVALDALRTRLLQHGEWRALARADRPSLRTMLDRLAEEASTLDAAVAYESINPAPAFVLLHDAFLLLDEQPMRAMLGAKQVVLDVQPDDRAVLEWLSTQHEPFTAAQLGALFPQRDVARLITALGDLLTPADAG